MAKTPSIRDNKKTDRTEDNPEAVLWAKCEELYAENEKAVDSDDYVAACGGGANDELVAADKRFEALYDLARDLSSEADDLRQQVISLEEDDASADMEDAIRDVLHEYSNLVVLRHPLLRKLHDSIAPGGLICATQ
jgi:predicted  nucleic acid-binding Zn-ribbon protein